MAFSDALALNPVCALRGRLICGLWAFSTQYPGPRAGPVDRFEIENSVRDGTPGMRRCGTRKVFETRGAGGVWMGDGLCCRRLGGGASSVSRV